MEHYHNYDPVAFKAILDRIKENPVPCEMIGKVEKKRKRPRKANSKPRSND